MLYLIGQILFLLLLVALMSGALGWLLRSFGHESFSRQQENDYAVKLAALRRSRDEYKDQLEHLQAGASPDAGAPGAGLDADQRAQVTAHVRQLEEEVNSGREKLANLTRRLEGVVDDSAQREGELATLREQLEAAHAAVAERDEKLKSFAAKATDVARQRSEDAQETQRELEEKASELEQTVEVQKLRIRELENSPEAQNEQAEHGKLLGVIQAQKKTIESLNQRVHEAGAEPRQDADASLKQVLREREATIHTLNDRVRDLTPRANATAEFERDNQVLTNALAERDEHIQLLRQRLEDSAVRPDASAQDELVDRLRIRDETIANLQNQLKQLNSAGQDEERYARMMEVVRAQEETIMRLNERLRQAASPSRTMARRTAAASIDELSGDLFQDKPDNILEELDGEPDNLQRINGVGPILESRLNELGVYHFRQIAAFGDDDIAWISNHMASFPNRIIRDRWIDQALELEAERTGSPDV